MIPAAADFRALAADAGYVFLVCPNCDRCIDIDDDDATVRDLIAAASAHATIHARAEINA